MLFKSIIFCSTFFAATFAGWNLSQQDSQQEKKSKSAQSKSAQSKSAQSQSFQSPQIENGTPEQPNKPKPNKPEQRTANSNKGLTGHLQFSHKDMVKSHMRCTDCHTKIDETETVEQFSKNYHAKKALTEGKESAFLGVITREIPAELRSHLNLKDASHGVMIEKVIDESPAFHCGLEEHDILVAIDDQDVIGTKGLGQIIRSQEPKSKISIRYIHQGKIESLSLVLGRHKTTDFDADFEIAGCHAKMVASTNCSSCHKSK